MDSHIEPTQLSLADPSLDLDVASPQSGDQRRPEPRDRQRVLHEEGSGAVVSWHPVNLRPIYVETPGHGAGASRAESVDQRRAPRTRQHRQDEPLHVSRIVKRLQPTPRRTGPAIEVSLAT